MKSWIRRRSCLVAFALVFIAGACQAQTKAYTETVLFSFCAVAQNGNCLDGSGPAADLIQGMDGNLYGTTLTGGAVGLGTLFKVTPSGTLTTLYSFCSVQNEDQDCLDGEGPTGPVTQGADGNFYGLTESGGSNGGGTLYKVTPAGTLTTLHNFADQDGPSPFLLLGANNNFYGMTVTGGSNSMGSIYAISSAGVFTTLYSFCSLTSCLDGETPNGGLTQGKDGNLYGTTSAGGGADNAGTIFRLTLDGVLDTMYFFCSQTGCADGSDPVATMKQGTDGNFYGVTQAGGIGNGGTIYRITPESTLTTLYNFCDFSSCTFNPSSLIQGSDGSFYGTIGEFDHNEGEFYSITPGGTFTLIYSFGSQASDGDGPTGVVQAKSGIFYGTTELGGNYGGVDSAIGGTVFEIGVVKAASTTTLAITPNPTTVGRNLTLTATTSGSYGTPTGSIVFSTSGVTLATSTLNSSGVATLSANTSGIAPGVYPVIATYAGSPTYNSSTSSAVDVLLKAASSTTLAASPNPVTPPAIVTLTATVKRSGAAETPTGDVTFYDGSTVVGTANLNASGVATLSSPTNGIPAGKYAVTAAYNGDNSDGTSTSPAVTVQVE